MSSENSSLSATCEIGFSLSVFASWYSTEFVEFDVEKYVKVVSDNVSLKSFVFLHLLMVLSEERTDELTKTVMYHETLKLSIYSWKKV